MQNKIDIDFSSLSSKQIDDIRNTYKIVDVK